MLEIIMVALFVLLWANALGLVFRLAWGVAKIIAAILAVFAFVALVLVFIGGLAIFVPLLLAGGAWLVGKCFD